MITGNSSSGENSSGGSSNTGGESGSSQSNTSSNNSSSSSGGSSSEESSQSKEQYSLDMVNPLTNTNNQIDWNDILNKIEEVYLAMPTITLDLYQTDINQQDILDFNSYLDNLTIEAKANNKQNTLARICDMYACLSKFVDAVANDEAYKASVKAKGNVLKGYALVDLDRWNEVVQNVQNGTDVISALLTNTNIEPEKQMSINKSYVIINELKNAAQKQDKEIFFTKYKNLLEEMNSL